MLKAIFSAIISSVLNFGLSVFGKSRDAENGALKVDNAVAKQEIVNAQKSKEISDRVDGLERRDPASLDKLRTDLNDRD